MTNTWDEKYLEMAKFVSGWSKDPSTKVGAVIADEYHRPVSNGYNGFPRGIADTEERLNNRELKYKIILHAEENAILFAGKPLENCTLYVWPFQPCSSCASKIIQAGIKKVVTKKNTNDRWKEDFELSLTLFKESGVEVVFL